LHEAVIAADRPTEPIDSGAEFWKHQRANHMQEVLSMTTAGHIEALERRHRDLDRQIDAEQLRPSADAMLIVALKRKKLEIKDELARLREPTITAA
jgi:hypothetical protein